MNKNLLTLFNIVFSFTILAESKTLGDWATFHREADNLCRQNQFEEAANLYRQIVKGRLPFQGNQHRDVGVTWNNLGVALYYLGENDLAKEAYEKGMKVLLPAVGANHPDILTVETNLAFIDESKNDFKKAEEKFRSLLQKKLPLVGAKNPELADCLEGLALSLEGLGKHEEALEKLKESLKIRTEKLGVKHTDVGATHAAMAIVFLNQADFDQANKHDQKARDILSASKGKYPLNLNPVSRLKPGPAELLRAKNKDLRIP